MATGTYGIATESNCVDIGGQGIRSNKAVIKSRLGNFGCRLKDSPSQSYTNSQCVKYVDIAKNRPDLYVYSVYLSHVGTYLSWGTRDTIFEFNEDDRGGWDTDSSDRPINPSRYGDSLRNSLNISCQINEDICHIYYDKVGGGTGIAKSFYGLSYSFNLGNSSNSASWELGSESGSTLYITAQVPPSSQFPEEDNDPEVSMDMVAQYFEKTYSNATTLGSSVKLKLYID